jgi:hypothetical protein
VAHHLRLKAHDASTRQLPSTCRECAVSCAWRLRTWPFRRDQFDPEVTSHHESDPPVHCQRPDGSGQQRRASTRQGSTGYPVMTRTGPRGARARATVSGPAALTARPGSKSPSVGRLARQGRAGTTTPGRSGIQRRALNGLKDSEPPSLIPHSARLRGGAENARLRAIRPTTNPFRSLSVGNLWDHGFSGTSPLPTLCISAGQSI